MRAYSPAMDMIGATAILPLSRAAAKLPCLSAIIDGEAIVQDQNGASDFDALSSAMRWRPDSIILYAFDLMHLSGRDLRQEPLSRAPRDFEGSTGKR